MATEQILSGYMNSVTYNVMTTVYTNNRFSLFGMASIRPNFLPAIIMPTPGIFYDLKVKLSTAPGAGKIVDWALVLFGQGNIRSLPVAITGTDTEGENRTNRMFVNAGDFVSCTGIQSTGTAVSDVTWSVKFQPQTADQTILGTSTLQQTTGDTAKYWSLASPFFNPSSLVEKEAEILIPGAGTIRHFRINLTNAPGSGKTRTFVVRKNLADTSLTLTYTDLEEDKKSDLVNSFTVAAGDRICIKSVGTGGAASTFLWLSVVFVPDNSGEWIWAMNMLGNLLNPITTTFIRPVATGEETSVTESDHQNIITPFDATATVEAVYARLTGSPGIGDNQYSFTLRKNATVQVGSTLVCDGPGVQSFISSHALSDNDLLSFVSVPFSDPTDRGVAISILGKCTNVPAIKRRVIVDGIVQFEGEFQS